MDWGVKLGIEGYPGYRFVVRMGIITSGSLLGPMVLGSAVLGGIRWKDVTADVQGATAERGGSSTSRPKAGELNLRLLNQDQKYSPYKSTFHGPGSLIQVLVHNGTNVYSQFVGITQSWNETSEGLTAYEWVDIVAWEGLFLWNDVDENALVTPVGGGETLEKRVDRLATKVNYTFSYDVVHRPNVGTLQATNLSQDMATELYLTMDSLECMVYCGKDGVLKIRDRATGNGRSWFIGADHYNPDLLVTQNDDAKILASIDLARVGGTAVTYVNSGVAGRYQKRSTKRTDMITVAEGSDADLARVAAGILGRSVQTYRPESVMVESGQASPTSWTNNIQVLIEGEICDRLTIHHPVSNNIQHVVFSNYNIVGLRHGWTVSARGVYWSGQLILDGEVDASWALM